MPPQIDPLQILARWYAQQALNAQKPPSTPAWTLGGLDKNTIFARPPGTADRDVLAPRNVELQRQNDPANRITRGPY